MLLKRGTIFSFSVPDAFNHEYEIRNFILTKNKDNSFNVVYHGNKCSCKDGWAKFENVPFSEGQDGITLDDLILYLEKQYEGYVATMTKIFKEEYDSVYEGNGFDKATLQVLTDF